jgi:four helix bundle protein
VIISKQKEKTRVFDLEERACIFSKNIRMFVTLLPKTISNNEDIKQLVRSSGSIGANYIEANESLGKKDFCMRIKISKKEAKESIYWLKLIDTGVSDDLDTERKELINEATQLMKILGAILTKSSV